MWLRVVAVTLCFLIVCASAARSELKTGKTGITGVVMVTPIRPGPLRKGSESPNAAPLPNAKFTVTSDGGAVTTFTTDTMGHFEISLKRATMLLCSPRIDSQSRAVHSKLMSRQAK